MNRQMQLWIDALRSGEYTQGKRVLQTDDGRFCCLGVLCDVYRKETGDGRWYDDGDGYRPFKTDDYSSAFPPDAVLDWLGVGFIILGIIEDPGRRALVPTEANDTLGWTFNQIADALERHYAGT